MLVICTEHIVKREMNKKKYVSFLTDDYSENVYSHLVMTTTNKEETFLQDFLVILKHKLQN